MVLKNVVRRETRGGEEEEENSGIKVEALKRNNTPKRRICKAVNKINGS